MENLRPLQEDLREVFNRHGIDAKMGLSDNLLAQFYAAHVNLAHVLKDIERERKKEKVKEFPKGGQTFGPGPIFGPTPDHEEVINKHQSKATGECDLPKRDFCKPIIDKHYPAGPKGMLIDDELAYWKQRCIAAENIILVLKNDSQNMSAEQAKLLKEWYEAKEGGDRVKNRMEREEVRAHNIRNAMALQTGNIPFAFVEEGLKLATPNGFLLTVLRRNKNSVTIKREQGVGEFFNTEFDTERLEEDIKKGRVLVLHHLTQFSDISGEIWNILAKRGEYI